MSATDESISIFQQAVTRRESLRARLEKGEWNDPVYKALPNLAQVKDGQLVMSSVAKEDPVVDAKTATARFLISSMRKDRDGDIVLPQGCRKSLADYERNPVIFFGHKSFGLPIARTVSLDIREDFGIYADAKFHCETQESEDVFRLVECGELRCASIGFFPVLGEKLEAADDSQLKKNEVLFQPWYAFKFTEWNLLEWSVVGIPANPDCLALRMAKGFGGRQLSEPVRRALQPYAAAPKIWANGFVPDDAVVPAVQPEPVPAPAVVQLSAEMLAAINDSVKRAIDDARAKEVVPAPAPVATPAPVKASTIDNEVLSLLQEIKVKQSDNAKRLRRMSGAVD